MNRPLTLTLAIVAVCCTCRPDDSTPSGSPSAADVDDTATDADSWDGSNDDVSSDDDPDVGIELRDSEAENDPEDRGCHDFWGPGLSRDGFEDAEPWSSLALADIESPSAPTFWEIRVYHPELPSEVLASSGPPCGVDEPDTCIHEHAAAADASIGFECHWLLGPQAINLIVRTEDGFFSFESSERLLGFFGEIDTPLEARLWVWTHCEYVGPGREVDSGFEFIVSTIEEVCMPVVAGEANLLVDADGRIRRGEERAIVSIECDLCI